MVETFNLKWEKNEKYMLLEQLENHYDDALWKRTLELYQEALDKQPDNPESLFSYGYLFEMKANRYLEEAASSYQKGLESKLLSTKYSWISSKLHAQHIRVRAQLFENHKSVEYYKGQLKKAPKDPRNYCYLAQCYLKSDQISEAKKVIDAGLKLFSTYAELHYYNGEIQSRLGLHEEALHSWEKSVQLDSQFIDGRFSRAFLFTREKRYLEAAQEWRLIIHFMNEYGFNDDYPKHELQSIEKLIAEKN
ncbi:hypothetical protein J8TS2_42910 [Lederbergia ruris]|uniref:Tetratricopeptide repeat protein n=1 Tax=Lederbergia ruris TaxID=217495 RepID=A0ABQ4KRJ7_9BACI|nr:hypothetical protein J8TS2_42910 [Lederbergia ruris]